MFELYFLLHDASGVERLVIRAEDSVRRDRWVAAQCSALFCSVLQAVHDACGGDVQVHLGRDYVKGEAAVRYMQRAELAGLVRTAWLATLCSHCF